jgi:leader peptidase (prepilin peptidase) / N-methyltransferase
MLVNSIEAYHFFFAAFAFVLGAVVGSFLNVCIYRMPLDLSVNEPRRSFCPSCKKQLKWYQNIPLLSWLFLRGRCANCGSHIAFRYFVVELVTALLFLAVWLQYPWPIPLAYWVFLSLLIVGIFIDLEHFIIPDEVTIGGTIAGLLASFLVPALMATEGRWTALLTSGLSALLGYVILWIVLEAGKKVFGKKKIQLDAPTPFTWTRRGEDADFAVGEEKGLWSDYFSRETDLLILHCDEAIVDARNLGKTDLRFHYNRVTIDGQEIVLDTLDQISGVVRELQIPREAMGRGDLKFLAAIGAFLGWRAVLFSVFAGSLFGSLVGLATLLVGQRVWSAKIPFGPYLAFGGLLWMFFGESLLSWYMGLMSP